MSDYENNFYDEFDNPTDCFGESIYEGNDFGDGDLYFGGGGGGGVVDSDQDPRPERPTARYNDPWSRPAERGGYDDWMAERPFGRDDDRRAERPSGRYDDRRGERHPVGDFTRRSATARDDSQYICYQRRGRGGLDDDALLGKIKLYLHPQLIHGDTRLIVEHMDRDGFLPCAVFKNFKSLNNPPLEQLHRIFERSPLFELRRDKEKLWVKWSPKCPGDPPLSKVYIKIEGDNLPSYDEIKSTLERHIGQIIWFERFPESLRGSPRIEFLVFFQTSTLRTRKLLTDIKHCLPEATDVMNEQQYTDAWRKELVSG